MSTPEIGATAPAAKGSRRKRKRTDENLNEAERARRQLQRHKQGLALKLRAEGKTYKRQKSDKSSTKAESALGAPKHGAVPQSQPRKQHQQSVPERPETGTRPGGPIQVIIVPIFWNKKADEKETVISAAQQVLQQLQELGIEVGLDDTNADTPGQKYRYWEQKGVKVRIELGPRDAHKSQACLAISTTPGEVAKKVTYQLGTELTMAVQSALAAAGTPAASQPGEAVKAKAQSTSKKESKSDQNQCTEHYTKATNQPRVVDSSQMPAVETAHGAKDVAIPMAIPAKSKAGKHKLPSGDDLGDEFPAEIEDAEDVGKKKKKAITNSSFVSTAPAAAKGKRSKHKVVSF